jgi:hypothetical protein
MNRSFLGEMFQGGPFLINSKGDDVPRSEV